MSQDLETDLKNDPRFCPDCSNLVLPKEKNGIKKLYCNTCDSYHDFNKEDSQYFMSKKYIKNSLDTDSPIISNQEKVSNNDLAYLHEQIKEYNKGGR